MALYLWKPATSVTSLPGQAQLALLSPWGALPILTCASNLYSKYITRY